MDRLPHLAIPAGWRTTSDPERGVLLAAIAPRVGGDGVAPTIRLEAEPVRTTARAWHDEAIGDLAARYAGFELVDEEVSDLSGHETGYRRFGHRRAGRELVTEQWAWLVDGVGLTLSCCAGREDHPRLSPVFEHVAATFVMESGLPYSA